MNDAAPGIDATLPDAAPPPDACVCPIAQRFVLHAETFRLWDGVAMSVACGTDDEPAGTELAAMSCSLAASDAPPGTALSLLGPSWSLRMQGNYGSCAWDLPDDDVSGEGIVTAVCLRPGVQEACAPQMRVIRRRAGEQPIPAGTDRELAVSCETGEALLAGACIPERHHGDIALLRAGFLAPEVPGEPRSWQCSFRNRGTDTQIDATAYCLESGAGACGCCPLPGALVTFEQRIQKLAPEGDTLLQIGCGDGARLVAGSCSLDGELDAIPDVVLHRMGFAPGDAGVWQCAWSNRATSTPQGRATAVCLLGS